LFGDEAGKEFEASRAKSFPVLRSSGLGAGKYSGSPLLDSWRDEDGTFPIGVEAFRGPARVVIASLRGTLNVRQDLDGDAGRFSD